ncbi:hypothetical protein [Streptomyces sp. NPDC015242]|uniref:hypothetical protein n=1 Tax=Streptomyces sp. NPDC015242 TaxID=3364951 RepID=UPI0036FF4F5F
MFETIHWRCFARVADRHAAGRVIGRGETLLSHAVELGSYERYRKFPELAELGFVSPLRCPTPEAALLTTDGVQGAGAASVIARSPGPPRADGLELRRWGCRAAGGAPSVGM